MAESRAALLIRSVGLEPLGPVTWGDPVPLDRPGVYVIEAPSPRLVAPLSLPAITTAVGSV